MLHILNKSLAYRIIIKQIVKEVDEKDIKEININEYLPEFSYDNKLNDDMVEYIELCLERES